MQRKSVISILSILLTYLSIFFILLYPFNTTIASKIYPNNFVCICTIVFSMLWLLLLPHDINSKVFSKKKLLYFVLSLVIILITLFNNYYIKEGFETRVILYSIFLFLPVIIYSSKDIATVFNNVIKIFLYEHIIATFIGIFFKEFYRTTILTFVCKGLTICTAKGNFYNNYIPGITSHFSTNAIYLSIAVLYFFSKWLTKKNKVNFIFCLVSVVALFATGKRAHLIFTIFAIVTLYLCKKFKKSNENKLIKIIFWGSLGVSAIFVLSHYIPEISNIFNRFQNLIDKGDVLNGRSSLYDLALKLWKNNIFFGNGWGSFSYHYQLNIYTSGQLSYLDAHNVFLQLLCEVGIFGAAFLMITMYSIFKKAFINIRKIVVNSASDILINFCFAFQLFFILYCLTGNPLYDPQCFVIYFITIGFTLLYYEKGEE